LTRRRALELLATACGSLTAFAACGPGEREPREKITLPDELPNVGPGRAANNVRALMDILLPAEFNDAGAMTSPGAVASGAFDVLSFDQFVPLAQAQGLLGPLPPGFAEDADELDGFLVEFLGTELDQMAGDVRALTPFHQLSRLEQHDLVRDAYDDPLRYPIVEFVRGICFLAYLGAVTSDIGLVDVGYPPFDDFGAGVANRGYPRRKTTQAPIDTEAEDIETLRALGDVDDYTFNEVPLPTPQDDLSTVIDAFGDLL